MQAFTQYTPETNGDGVFWLFLNQKTPSLLVLCYTIYT